MEVGKTCLPGVADDMIRISVIIPVFGVEKFIGKCVDSLSAQTFADAEYIFVDDATPDGSMKVLERTLSMKPDFAEKVKILHHKQNRGLPAARNTGLAEARGEYIIHCDSDDYMEPDMLEKMYSAAVGENADIVWSDWYLTFSRNERYMKEPAYTEASDALKAMLGGAMKYNVWNKLARKSLYEDNGISFPSGYAMGEDMVMMLLFACASKVCHVPDALYHYVKMNTVAISWTPSAEKYEALKHNVTHVTGFIRERYGAAMDRELAYLKLDAKFPFLIMAPDRERYRLWTEWYPETGRYIMQNKSVSCRRRLLQWFASKGQFWLVRLHYYLVCRLVYGIIYR